MEIPSTPPKKLLDRFRDAIRLKHYSYRTEQTSVQANQYSEALQLLEGGTAFDRSTTQKWICLQCSMIYDPAVGDPDSGSAAATPSRIF